MIIGWPVVSFLNLLRSSGKRQRRALALPMAMFLECATMILMRGFGIVVLYMEINAGALRNRNKESFG